MLPSYWPLMQSNKEVLFVADLKILKELCSLYGVSGNESPVREFLINLLTPFADRVQTDALGNLIVWKQGRERAKTRLMLSAHMDEVGFVVTHITEDGLLKFTPVGGIDNRILCGKPVLVNGHYGVIGGKPIHLMKGDEREKAVPADDLSIDIGAADRAQAEEAVSLGDAVGFVSGFDTAGGMVRARALDDRAGCAVLAALVQEDLPYDMTFVFCVQEEIGLRGARTAAYQVDPQAAIVVECTTAADISGVAAGKHVCRLGDGPVVPFMDRSTIYDREYYQLAFRLAQENGLKCQTKHRVAGGNDAGAIHVSRGGVRTVSVSLPCRYLHAPMGMIAQDDFFAAQALVRLLAGRIAATPCV